ncbi:hypothetical protein ACFQZC_26475 [Streptacidiphilus monticola]
MLTLPAQASGGVRIGAVAVGAVALAVSLCLDRRQLRFPAHLVVAVVLAAAAAAFAATLAVDEVRGGPVARLASHGDRGSGPVPVELTLARDPQQREGGLVTVRAEALAVAGSGRGRRCW